MMTTIPNTSGSYLPQRAESSDARLATPSVAPSDQAGTPSTPAAETLVLSAASRVPGPGIRDQKLDLAGAAKVAFEAMEATPSRQESIKIGRNALLLFSQKSDSLMVRVGLAALEGCQPDSPRALETIKETLRALKKGGDGSMLRLGELCSDLLDVSFSFVFHAGEFEEAAAKGLKMARVLKESSNDPFVRSLATLGIKEIKASLTPESAFRVTQSLFNSGIRQLQDQPDSTSERDARNDFRANVHSVRANELQGDYYQPPGFAGIQEQ